jgi:hypothetical protein
MDEPTDLANLLVGVVDLVCGCLETTAQQNDDGSAVTGTGRPGSCAVYWNTPPDDLDCGDCASNGGLYVWLESLAETVDRWPAPWMGAVSAATAAFTMPAAIAVRLIRPCWPVVGGGGTGTSTLTPFPARETTEARAVNLLIDAATVQCCLMSAIQERSASGPFGRCGRCTPPTLRPDNNRGGCAGFTVRFIADLGACCGIPTEGTT